MKTQENGSEGTKPWFPLFTWLPIYLGLSGICHPIWGWNKNAVKFVGSSAIKGWRWESQQQQGSYYFPLKSALHYDQPGLSSAVHYYQPGAADQFNREQLLLVKFGESKKLELQVFSEKIKMLLSSYHSLEFVHNTPNLYVWLNNRVKVKHCHWEEYLFVCSPNSAPNTGWSKATIDIGAWYLTKFFSQTYHSNLWVQNTGGFSKLVRIAFFSFM